MNLKPRIEGLSECGLDSVQEGHGVRDAVEGLSCPVIQVHSYSGGGNRDLSYLIIVPERVTGRSAEQTPGLLIKSQVIIRSFPADLFIRHCYINLTQPPLSLPVTDPLCTALGYRSLISLDDQDMAGSLSHGPPPPFPSERRRYSFAALGVWCEQTCIWWRRR